MIPAAVTTVAAGLAARAANSGVTLVASLTDDIAAAGRQMERADVVVVCAGASTTESVDRASLALDQVGT